MNRVVFVPVLSQILQRIGLYEATACVVGLRPYIDTEDAEASALVSMRGAASP